MIEALLALAVWMFVAAAACGALYNVTEASAGALDKQDAFENARGALDALTANIQLATDIELQTDADGVLKQLTLTEKAPDGKAAAYIFYFNKNAVLGEAKYHRLEFGLNDEFASRIESINITQSGDKLLITVVSDEPGVTLSGSADTRYKRVKVTIHS